MHTLIALVVAVAAACVARPSDPTVSPALSELPHRSPIEPPRRFLNEFIIPQLLLPNYYGMEDSIRGNPPDEHEWLNKEIARLNQMEEEEEALAPLDVEMTQWMPQVRYIPRHYEVPMRPRLLPNYIPDSPALEVDQVVPTPKKIEPEPEKTEAPPTEILTVKSPNPVDAKENKETFAMTPLEKGYYEPETKVIVEQSGGPHEGDQSMYIEVSPPRPIRQNPNLGRTKNLVADNLGNLRNGLANKDYRIPVSLLPTNLRWLRVKHPTDETSTQQVPDGTAIPGHVVQMETTADPGESIYGIALVAAVGASVSMAAVGFAFGWYTISRKAKAAADVDYPAYGVTGPNIDSSGDRKLAHSAHMYHYQHQKQQIIAMERNGLEQRNGSVSDPESEEENEEGDYTVYECPGFATTGEMEVKNPLFSEDPTPATPGKCELVKPQPKE